MGGTWEKKKRGKIKAKGKNQVWEEIKEMYSGSGNLTESCSNGGCETVDCKQKVPETRKVRAT